MSDGGSECGHGAHAKGGEDVQEAIYALWMVQVIACASWEDLCHEDLANWFYWVPSEILEQVPGEHRPDPVQIPFNKKIRKKAEEVTLTVHLFAGQESRVWKATEDENSMVLLVELEKGQDLHNNHLYGWLCGLARRGRISVLIGGPPFRTVSLARYRYDDGPKPVRARTGYQRFGLDTNSIAQQYVSDCLGTQGKLQCDGSRRTTS